MIFAGRNAKKSPTRLRCSLSKHTFSMTEKRWLLRCLTARKNINFCLGSWFSMRKWSAHFRSGAAWRVSGAYHAGRPVNL